MNVTDLREVLDEQSALEHADVRAHLMLVGVHHRIKVRRQRRQLVAAAAAVVAVVAVLIGVVGLPRTRHALPTTTPKPSPTVRLVDGFPEYRLGSRVIATADLGPGQTELSLTVTPTSSQLSYFARCSDPKEARSWSVSVDGRKRTDATGCDGVIGDNDVLRPNRPARIRVTFPAGRIDGFSFAVGEPVPADQYVFPPRPTPLEPLALDEAGNVGFGDQNGTRDYVAAQVVRADPADPNRPRTYDLTWGSSAALSMLAQTPGSADVTVDGVKVLSGEWWDYEQGSSSAELLPGDNTIWKGHRPVKGQTVTITVTPHRMTGDWALVIALPRKN